MLRFNVALRYTALAYAAPPADDAVRGLCRAVPPGANGEHNSVLLLTVMVACARCCTTLWFARIHAMASESLFNAVLEPHAQLEDMLLGAIA
jgi:hypothetical protein